MFPFTFLGDSSLVVHRSTAGLLKILLFDLNLCFTCLSSKQKQDGSVRLTGRCHIFYNRRTKHFQVVVFFFLVFFPHKLSLAVFEFEFES